MPHHKNKTPTRRTALLAQVVFILLCWLGQAHAIAPDRKLWQLNHKSWTAKDGVPTSITSIAQTADGYLWLGTATGLYRFDGARFEEYRPAIGTYPNSSVYFLKAQPGGGLWIGWQHSGISFLHHGVLRNFSSAEVGAVADGTVWGFDFTPDGSVWAAGINGIARYDGKRWRTLGADAGYTAKKTSAVFVDRAGRVGAFSEQGLFIWEPGATRFAAPIGKTDTRQPPQQGPDGRIYFMEDRGIRVIDSLARYDEPDHPLIYREMSGGTGSMLIDRDNRLWFDTVKGGVHRADPDNRNAFDADGLRAGTDTFSNSDGLTGNLVSLFYEDSEGSMWVATGNGLDRFRQVDINVLRAPDNKLRVDGAGLLAGPDDTIWLGRNSPRLGLLRMGPDGRRIASPYNDSGGALAYGPDGALWSVGWRTVRRLGPDGRTTTVALPPDMGPVSRIHRIMPDADGGLWASLVGGGIYRYRDGKWERPVALPGEGKRSAMSMVTDGAGRRWFGYGDNLIVRLADGKATQFASAQGMELGAVSVLYLHEGQLWAAGRSGVALLRGEAFVPLRLTATDAVNVSGMLIDGGGDMWLNTSRGLLRLPAAQVRAAVASGAPVTQARLFDATDGLAGVATLLQPQSLALAGDGKIWLATRENVGWLDPAALMPVPAPAAVLIQAISAAGMQHRDPAQRTSVLQLPPNSRDVRIDYASTILNTPERVRFKYRLLGYDEQWQDAGLRRQAFYTGLAPGDYRFQVMAEHGEGNWGPQGDGLRFTVLPAYYQTWWFRALMGALAALAVWLLYRWRLRRVELRFRERIEARQAERERIARELHDTLLQGTQAMILRFHSAAIALPAQDPARALMDRALEQADHMLVEGRERVHDLRASDHFGVGVAALIERDGAALAREAGVQFTLHEHGDPRPILPATCHELYRIAIEAVSNAARHAQARAIVVEVRYEFGGVGLTVSDDGRGVPADVLQRGHAEGHWGLPGMRERAARVMATLQIVSPPGKGTRVTLRIPAKLAYAASRTRWLPWF